MKLIYVEWLDHCSFQESRWRARDEFDEDYEPQLVTSVGWVLKETDDFLVLVPSVMRSEEFDDKFLGDLCVMKGSIKKQKELKV